MREVRHILGIRPVYKTVDTCAGEFPALTPYHYSSYDLETEVVPSDRRKVVILGSGPNRIGQGVEFDYSCVHASFALSDAGFETIMINCNPETVSTDYDTSDRLYFEPLTLEDVLEVIHAESQSGELVGVVVQLGGQTALGLAKGLEAAGVPILGTTPEAIDLAEERGLFSRHPRRRGPARPAQRHRDRRRGRRRTSPRRSATRCSCARATCSAAAAWRSSTTRPSLADYFERIEGQGIVGPTHPLLVDRFLDDAIEIDVDALYDGTELYIGGVMEHIEEAGIHSGDSSCTLPPVTLGRAEIDRVREATLAIAEGIGVRGLLNVQFAIGAGVLYVLEANPRASRTVPFVSKALGIPLAKAASRIMVGAHDRRAHRPRACCPAATARACRSTRPSPSRRPCCRSSASAPRRASSSTRCSAPRCARPARSWASTATSRGVRQEPAGRVRRHAARRAPCSSRSPTATSARSSCRCCACSSSASRSSRPRAPPRCCAATASRRARC